MNDRFLVVAIVVLALADGILHLALDLYFSTRFPSFFTSTLGVLFLVNFIGYVVLTAAFVFGRRRLGNLAWGLDLLLIAYAAGSIGVWIWYGLPNPMRTGYLSKALEVLLLIAAVAHLWRTLRRQAAVPADTTPAA